MNSPQVKHPSALILAPDAVEYLPFLQELAGQGVNLTPAETVDAARAAYSGQKIVLGQPDMVAAVLADMPALCWVQSTWAGVTPLLNAGRSDYLLTGVKDVFGAQMAEYVLAYLLAKELKVFQRLGRQANRSWWEQPSGTLQGKTLGIMGTGSIGADIARMARVFGVRVLGFSRSGSAVDGFEQVFAGDQLADFLAQPDYLVCVLPDTAQTRHLLDADAFRVMKDSCYLVNVGRGALIDEAALVRALFDGELAGAVLDVFQQEPLAQDSPLWNAPELVVTAHIAATSRPREIAGMFIENYQRFVNDEPLNYLVDFTRGY